MDKKNNKPLEVSATFEAPAISPRSVAVGLFRFGLQALQPQTEGLPLEILSNFKPILFASRGKAQIERNENKSLRKLRNQRYYRKRKQKVAPKRGVILPFTKEHPSVQRITSISFPSFCFMFALVLLSTLITVFFITETAKYFFEVEGSSYSAFLKAVLCETTVVILTLLKSSKIHFKALQCLVVIGMSTYTVWTTSSSVLVKADKEYSESNMLHGIIPELESRVAVKRQIMQQYTAKNWLSAARTTQKDLDVLENQLMATRQAASKIRNSHLILNGVLNAVLFRILLLLSNILCVSGLKDFLSQLRIRDKQSYSLAVSNATG